MIYDWVIQHKETRLLLGKDRLVERPEDAVFASHSNKPYVKAAVTKQVCFSKSDLPGLEEGDFKIWGGINPREEDV